MPVAYFRVPYVEEPYGSSVVRVLPLSHLPLSYWSEVELGDFALVRARGTTQQLNAVGQEFQAADESLWRPIRKSPQGDRLVATRPLANLNADVLTDDAFDDLRRQAEGLMAVADRQGYVRLSGHAWPDAARLLTYLGRNGYGLDRVSTGTFPTTGVLETFTGADGTSPPNANWTNGYGASSNPIEIRGNACESAHVTNEYSSGWWNADEFGPDFEAFCTITSKGGNNDEVGLALRMRSPGTAGFDLYQANAVFFDAATDEAKIFRADDGVYTQLGATVSQEWAVGEKLGFEAIGATLTLYRFASGAWASVLSRTDATYVAAGSIGTNIRGANATTRSDDFGGGTVVAAGDFPTTALLTTFNGADEDPLSEGGTWVDGIQAGVPAVRRVANEADTQAAGGDCQACYDTAFAADQEVYATILEVPSAGQGVAVWFGIIDNNTAGVDAYLVYYDSGNFGIAKCVNGTVSGLGTATSKTPAVGHKIGGRRIGTTIQAWYFNGTSWSLDQSVTDSSVTGSGRLGIELNGGGRFDDFGGGNYVEPEIIPFVMPLTVVG